MGFGVVGQPIWSQRLSSIDGQPIVAAGDARGTVNTISWVACDCEIRLQATRSDGFSFVDYNVWFQCSAFLPAAVAIAPALSRAVGDLAIFGGSH